MPPANSRDSRGLLRFAVVTAGLSGVWLGLLPWLGEQETVQSRIHANEARGINPGAMYYTELEAMPRIGQRVDRRREASHDAFWRVSSHDGEMRE